ncbi:MAG TPA: transglycosylase SLT domain-containing protein [Longimicrobiales bacterium]|nr:transglycosylase SLT domain-containing protein [Longimicrobiales bacterium]
MIEYESESMTRSWRWRAYGFVLLVVLIVVGAWRTPEGTSGAPLSTDAVAVETPAEADEVSRLLERARLADEALRRVEGMYAQEVAPIDGVLRSYRDDPELTREIAVALVREAHRANLEPRVLLSVLLVENPMLEPRARSFVGAVGLMQVMPLHRGNWGKCEPDLESIEANICHGAQIFASYLRQTGGDVDRALLRYNGCVRGTNTPNCHRYPSWVYARAGRVSMMTWLATSHVPQSGGAAAP